MPSPASSDRAFVPFVSVDNMMRLIQRIGVEQMLADPHDLFGMVLRSALVQEDAQ